jgi:hypothetical protein
VQQIPRYSWPRAPNFHLCLRKKRRVPHISLVFREMWDSTALSAQPAGSHTGLDLAVEALGGGFTESHISQKTSEIWGTRRLLHRQSRKSARAMEVRRLKIKQRLEVEVPHGGTVGEESARQLGRLAKEGRIGGAVRRPAKRSVRRRKIHDIEQIVSEGA